jgi:hypothetical protein
MVYVLCGSEKRETRMISAVITGRKLLIVNHRDLVLLGVLIVMCYAVNPRAFANISRLKFVASLGIGHAIA